MKLAHRFFLPIIVLATYGCGSLATLEPGNFAPDFDLKAVRGGSYHLADLSGQVVLLSFINTQAKAAPGTADPSRAQIVFLKSMQEQFGTKGLVVVIVDAAGIATGNSSEEDQLINFTYDWQLDDVITLDDPNSAVARSYSVTSTPTTFLIGADGIIQQRWDGFASASQLALSIEAVEGKPAQHQIDAAESPATPPAGTCPNDTQPQAKFAGVGLARQLSEELWVVDGGEPWGTGAAFPVQWILFDAQSLTQRAAIHIRVLGKYTDTQQMVVLSDGYMEILSTDIASGLLSGNATLPTVYSLITTVFLERPGCLKLLAVVTHEETIIPLYQGNLVISVR